MKIPNKVKKWSYGIALFLFLIRIFIPYLFINLVSFVLEYFDYYMSFSLSILDFILLCSIPIIALYLNKKRAEFNLTELIIDNVTLIISVIVVSVIAFYFLTEHSTSTNPLIPDNIIIEPFNFFWTLVIGLGLILPFIVIKQTKRKNKENNNPNNVYKT